ncbi:MAG: hypothetical protein JXB14_05845 [Candidatus Altiarchaeota archaeon]|nr:hypothetical protein [Candidatus Altiarchaeota archaeon]
MSLKTIKRIRWKNIFGLIFLVLVVVIIFTFASWVTFLVEGECTEKNSIKVCFEMSKDTVPKESKFTIKTTARNVGETARGLGIRMYLSPNLENASVTLHSINSLAPGDSVERTFTAKSKREVGRFKIWFDIDSDGKSDKDLYLDVE